MSIDGAAIARDIEEETMEWVRALGRTVRLSIFTCEPNLATKRFLELKSMQAEKLGVTLSVEECASESTTEDIVRAVSEAAKTADGIIVQLPLPSHIDTASVLAEIPAHRDVDAIGEEAGRMFAEGHGPVLPPVVGAIAEIAKRRGCEIEGKHAVVVGEGKLVGAPAALWLAQNGAHVCTINKRTEHIEQHTRKADILVLGAGSPGLITPDMIKEGAMIFDAGSSEDTGKLVGDADPACAEKASLFTPVPGGIGPITVALIFKNLLTLIDHQKIKQ